jgi:Na+-driven multidrug efflux pump
MPLTPGQERTVLYVLVVALPLAIMLTGIFVYRKRRHR